MLPLRDSHSHTLPFCSQEKNKAPPPELVSQKPDKMKEGAWTEPLKTAGAPIATGDAPAVVETAAPEVVAPKEAPKEEGG